MKKFVPIAISIVITTILFTGTIGLIKNVNSQNTVIKPTATSAVTQYDLREQQYQQLIAEANAKIVLANDQIEQLAGQVSTLSIESPTEFLFNPEQAAALAENIAGVAPELLPDLVNFNGTLAYEAVFKNGKLYIDANKGKILFNGLQTISSNISPEQAIKIAENYLNRTDFSTIDVDTFEGVTVYIVGFSDGTLVYINLSGQILAIQMPQATSSTIGNDDPEYDESEDESDDEPDDESDDESDDD